MGKGSRNREFRLQDRFENSSSYNAKNGKKQGAPKWLFSAISLFLVVVIVGAIVVSTLADNGVFKRGNILIKSETGKFDMTQQMATYIAWEGIYYQAYTYYYYMQLGYLEDTNGITKTYKSADQYALEVAASNIQGSLRDSVDDIADNLLGYVAIADEAHRQGYTLTEAELAEVEKSLDTLENLQTTFGFRTLNNFLNDAIAQGVRKTDIRKALRMVTLYNKYCTDKQAEFKAALTLADLEKYRDENPESFYSTDYLTYATENEELANQLKAATSPEEFKTIIADHYFSENYKTIYNKYTVTADATEKLGKLTGKVNDPENGGTALSTALDEIGAGAEKTYSKKTDTTLAKTMTDWLFAAARKPYESTSLLTDDGVYVIAIMGINKTDDDTVVTVRELFLPLEEGETNGEDTAFKTTIEKNYKIELELLEDEEFKVEKYKTADAKATEFKATLEAEGADIGALLTAAEATEVKDATKNTTTVPESIRKAIFTAGVKMNSLHKISVGNAVYVVWVKECPAGDTPTKATLVYKSFEGDLYYKVLDDLVTGGEKNVPTDKTANYTAEPKDKTVEKWLFGTVGDNFASTVKANDTTIIETEASVDGTAAKTKIFNVYIALENPMHIDTEMYANGGYASYKTADAEKAQTAFNSLAGKTGTALTDALTAANSSATVTESITSDGLTDEKLHDWFFSADRKANDTVILDNAAGDGKYVAVYLGQSEAWKVSATSGATSERVSDLIESFSKNYSIKEKALKKLGAPTPETTATTTAAS